MKKFFLTLLFAGIFLPVISSAQPSCKSIFSGAERIFNNLSQDFIKFRMDAAQVFLDVIIPGKQGSNKAMNDLIDDATKMQIDLYKSYGVITGQSNATIGAVDLIVPLKKWTGDLYTERTFQIMQSPYDKIVITIKKTDGKRGVEFTACAKYSNGSPYDTKSGKIENGNETAGQVRTITFQRNMLDKNISLHLVAHGALPTDKCEYTLTVEGFFDENEMKEIAKANPADKDNKKPQVKESNTSPAKVSSGNQPAKMNSTKQPAVTNEIVSPRDPASGLPTGKKLEAAPDSLSQKKKKNN